MTATELHTITDRLRSAGLLEETRGVLPASIRGLSTDSRTIRAGDLFVALRGTQVDGHRFISTAIDNGARVVACEVLPQGSTPPGVAFIRVRDSADALASMASTLHGDPASAMRMMGVTGTNGKTTTAWLIAQALTITGEPCGFIGTIGYGLAPELRPTAHTTPDPVALHGLLADGLSRGWTACAMEVSSHALEQKRTAGIPFTSAVYTNLTHDHLDFHGDMAAYATAKARLFVDLGEEACAIINGDDPHAKRVTGRSKARRLVYGTGPEADVVYSITADSPTGLQLQLDGRTATFRLAGSFNAANLAAAYSTLLSLDVSPAEGIEALAQAQPAPGRFEPVHTSAGTTAIVDYAHTPDALENVLLAARRLCRGHLWCVFGCGGDRDAKKRPVMARTAERLCDRIVLTSDNPRSEHPGAIIEDMIAGLHRPSGATVHADRASAIQYALGNAGPQDVVVVAGKGHETYQVLSDRTIEFDDRKVIRNAAVEA